MFANNTVVCLLFSIFCKQFGSKYLQFSFTAVDGWLVVSLLLAAAFFGCPIITLVFFFLMKMRIGENCSIERLSSREKRANFFFIMIIDEVYIHGIVGAKNISVLFCSGRPPSFYQNQPIQNKKNKNFLFFALSINSCQLVVIQRKK